MKLTNINISVGCPGSYGGIAGEIDSSKSEYYTKTIIENCYVSGKILVDTTDDEFGSDVGGILGVSGEEYTIRNCYSMGSISIKVTSIECWVSAGGITASSVGVDDKIICCYSRMDISATNNTSDETSLGVITDTRTQNSGGVSGCYYPPYQVLSGGTHLLPDDSMKEINFEDWDFEYTYIWKIEKGINDGYPILQWMESSYQVESPYANMKSGTYTNDIKVELMNNTPGATIYYTTDGKTPTTSSSEYSGYIMINKDTTLKLIAVSKNYAKSKVVTYKYAFSCLSPYANYANGKSFSSTTNIILSTKEKNATIYYTTNGKTPTTKSMKYTKMIPISKDTIIKAITVVSGKGNSKISTFNYYVNAATPTSNKSSGTYTSSFQVKLSTTTKGAVIYYTTDGKTPTSKSKKYIGVFSVSKNTVVKAIAINGKVKSTVASWNYKVK